MELEKVHSTICLIRELVKRDRNSLRLSGHSSTPLSVAVCQQLSYALINCQKLLSLSLSKNAFPEQGLAWIAEGISLSRSLETLDLSQCKLGELPSSSLDLLGDAVAQCQTLVSIDLHANHLGSRFRLNSLWLTWLDLSSNNLSYVYDGNSNDSTVAEIVSACPELVTLFLDGCHLGEAGVESLADALSHTRTSKLMHLDLSGNSIMDGALEHLCSAIVSLNIPVSILVLGRNSISDQGCLTLSQLELKLLDVSHNRISDVGAGMFTRVRKLNIRSNDLTGAFCRRSSLIAAKSRVCSLNLNGNPVQALALSPSLETSRPTLRRLYLSGCSLGDTGMVVILRALQQNISRLRVLEMSRNMASLNSTLVAVWQCLVENTSLESLNLSWNLFASSGIAWLFDMASNEEGNHRLRLHEIDLSLNPGVRGPIKPPVSSPCRFIL